MFRSRPSVMKAFSCIHYFNVCVMLLTALLFTPSLCFAQLPDPTRPPVQPELSNQPKEKIRIHVQFVLSAILYSKDRCVAVINGQLLQTGDTINGYTLSKIETNKILLKGFNETQEITLITEQIKSPTKKH